MNSPVLHFTPRSELTPLANLMAFIGMCRESDVLSARGQFEKNSWDIGRLKGHNKMHRAIFSTLEAAANGEAEPSMPKPFLDFAKATLVYLHDKRPVTSQSVRVAALRCLEAALRDLNKDSRPTAVNEEVLDQAVELARKQMSPSAAYRVAGQIQYIAEFMRAKEFVEFRQGWNHGMKRPEELGSRVSEKALTAREQKLPSAAKLRALGGIFYEAVEPPDVLVSSYTALMLCAPERINEVLRLRRNCLVEGDGDHRGKLGLRWPGSKGAENTTKWLPTEMSPIAREAVSNLIEVTSAAQRLAAWYTANPTKVYLHEEAAHLRSKGVLSLSDIGVLLWGNEGATQPANSWARIANGLASVSLGGRSVGYTFEDVEKAVIKMLPATFPYMPGAPELLCADAMALMRTHETHPKKSTYLCMFSCVDYESISNHLGGRKDMISIFKRFEYTEDDGSPLALKSHSLRHYLNMLAQSGGLSSTEIAIFSGRKDVRQNRAYDHMTSDEVQTPISRALKRGFTSGLVPAAAESRNLVTRPEFRGLGLAAAHATEYGWCRHDFASEPCQIYRDCLNCEEQECVKGDEQKEANLRLLKTETEFLLKQAREALSEEEFGADVWVQHQEVTLSRVNALLAIFGDPNVPVGARVRLDIANAPIITAPGAQPDKVIKVFRKKALT